MGNFFVNGISEVGSNKCGNLLIELLEKAPRFESTSLFGKTHYNNSNYLALTENNPFSHPFVSNSWVSTYDPFLAGSQTSYSDILPPDITMSSFTSSSFIDYIPQVIQDFIPRVSRAISNGVKTVTDTVSSVVTYVSGTFGDLISYAKSFVNKVNSDREGNRIFSGGKKQHWCADFVTYCVRKTFGNKIPSSFGSSAVSGLRDWGSRNGCYFEAPYTQGLTAMRNFLKTKVKPGDIMIEKRNGKSHTGIVTYVDPEGKFFKTVEGNASDSVAERTYSADSKTLSGFVSLAKFA